MIPKHIPQCIDGQLCMLRRIRMDDVTPFYRYVSDDESVQYMFFEDAQRTAEGARGLVEAVCVSYDTDEPACILAIADPETGEYMGNLGAQSIANNQTEIFYALLPEYRGKGYVTDAVKTFVQWLFAEGVPSVVAFIIPANVASLRVMQRLNAMLIGDAELHGHPALRYDITPNMLDVGS